MKSLFKRFALCIVIMGAVCATAQAQVRGTVKDASGEPVIGAAVMIQGTTTGTTTDIDGAYSINASSNATLEVSSIGYQTQTIQVQGRSVIDIILEEDSMMLDDVVVVGYGTQKKSVVTASISSITSDNLKHQSNTRVDNVLQGMSSGVFVTQSSGAPGASSQVRIRGIGSINNSEPLYIVDGLAISGGIDYLNPSDIERIEVLKDAASGAVYGARAANGVILVTTKKGAVGNTKVSYDASYGWSNPWRKPQVLNATEYAIMMNEGYLNSGAQPIYDDPYSFGKGTDWVDAIFNYNAPTMKHDVNISGGNQKVNYSISAGYLSKEGTIGGNFGRSNYDRFTLRENIGVNIFDKSESRNYLNKMDITTSASYARINATDISANSEYSSPLGSALGMSPLEPILATAEMEELYKQIYPTGYPYIIRNKDGQAYSIADGSIYNEQNNPLAMLEQPGGKNWTDKFVGNATAELQIWDGLKFKTSVGIDLAFWGSNSYSLPYFLSSKNYKYDTITSTTTYDKNGNASSVDKIAYGSGASQEMNRSFLWQVENILTYNKTFGKHTVNALLGQTALSSSSSYVGASAQGLMYPDDPWKITVHNTLGQQKDGDRNGWGSWNSIVYSLASYFARLSYNYDECYMLEATVRRDGSSRFGPNNKWGVFPSISLGWNFKNESFGKSLSWLSAGKLRASYGVNGNDKIGEFVYAVYMNSGNNYVFGSGALGTESINVGAKPDGLANPNAKWEESHQTDLGLDLGFLGGKITFTGDWYRKETIGMLMDMQVPSYAGDSAPIGNVGNMVNSGIELDLTYRNQIGKLSYYVTANASYAKNHLSYLGDDSTFLTGSSHKIGSLTRGVVGMTFPYFYGWKTDGVFQNMEEVNSYVNKDGALLQPKAEPGDLRFVDYNEDGVINDADRTYLGKGIPDWTFGLNFGFEWNGFDFNMLLQGQTGNDIFNVTRRTDLYYINLPKTILNRWTGEGSTNKYPRFTFDSANENYRVSDMWIEKGSFLRARNVQLGYTLPSKITKMAGIERFRIYVQAENAFTLTKYTGCDPEVNGGNGFGTEAGIDRGVYPQARTISVGLNLNF
ncbi:MAG: TonB-dependent receptor [Bacteroidales bacterium]|nr:TonB-dependent receptor [Bacteroidales bacterium]